MDKDLIIGAAFGYDWNQLKYWVNSIKKTGFSGDIILVIADMTEETIERLLKEGVKLVRVKTSGQMAPHVERFFYLYHALDTICKMTAYRYVIVTDTRDVIFQTNPSDFFEEYYDDSRDISLFVSSEGMYYVDEPWGNQNLLETFGPFFHNIYKDKLIYNVGVIAGKPEIIKSLMLIIFQMSINRPIPVVDQAVFNFLIHQEPLKSQTEFISNSVGWAIQLGTTYEAVVAGKGDLGMAGLDAWRGKYDDFNPCILNGIVYSEVLDESQIMEEDEIYKFCIVHQWDRVPELAKKIEELYG